MKSCLSTVIFTAFFVLGPLVAFSEPKNCLWHVESGDTTIHLLGSIHTLTREAYPLSKEIEAAYNTSATVIFEIDLTEIEKGAFALLTRGTLKNGQKLNQVLSAHTWAKVVARLEATGLGIDGFDTMKPWFLAMTLLNFELTRAGYSSANGIDFHFHQRAITDDKKIIGLESLEYQISLFDHLSQELSEDFLRYTLDEFDDIIPMIEDITTAWKTGNTEKLAGLLNDDFFKKYPRLFNSIVTDRNNAWVEKIETIAAGDEDVLVIVGALHLVGKNGIVEQLRGSGFRVTQH